MDEALAQHAVTSTALARQIDRALLQHTGAKRGLDLCATPCFENHGIDAREMQKMREQQASRPGTHNANLSSARSLGSGFVVCHRWRSRYRHGRLRDDGAKFGWNSVCYLQSCEALRDAPIALLGGRVAAFSSHSIFVSNENAVHGVDSSRDVRTLNQLSPASSSSCEPPSQSCFLTLVSL